MRVVIVGSYSLSEMEIEPVVMKLLADLIEKYPKLQVIAMETDRGVGKIIKNLCLPPESKKPRFCLQEFALRFYSAGPELTSAARAAVLIARNAFLAEVGEEFHIFMGNDAKHGSMMMDNLYSRLREQRAMVAVYRRGDVDVKEAKAVAE